MPRIFLVAGHSLKQGGAAANNLREEKLSIELRDLIVEALKNQSPETEVIVDNDSDSLNTVISKFRDLAKPEDLLLDIHFNAAANEAAHGTESFIKVGASDPEKRIAERITELTAGMLYTRNRGVKFENQSQHNRLGILHTSAKSILWEVEFITNPTFINNYTEMKERLSIGVANILIQELY